MKEELYRLKSVGTIPAPVQVRSAGFYETGQGWCDPPLFKNFLELFWCVSGTLLFGYGAAARELPAGHICCYLPGDRHQVHSNEAAEYYWITFDGEEVDSLIRSFSLSREPRAAGPCPRELFHRIFRELRDLGVGGEFRAGLIGYEILLRTIYRPEGSVNELVAQFRHEVETRFSDPELGIAGLAEELGVHRSTLMRRVRAECGLSPQEYLDSYRVQHAIRLLQSSAMTVKEIAEKCGFNDRNYFSKAFRKKIGKTPSEIR